MKYLSLIQIVILASTLTSEWGRGDGMVAQLVEAVPYKQEGRAFHSRWDY